MTKQEAYDLLVQCATDGTFPSIGQGEDGQWNCRYRAGLSGDCKKKCAAGVFMPDENYNPKMDLENMSPYHKEVTEALVLPEEVEIMDLSRIQTCHDSTVLPFTDPPISKPKEWDAKEFIRKIDGLDCFQDVKRVEVD